jgi:hypothetical protein
MNDNSIFVKILGIKEDKYKLALLRYKLQVDLIDSKAIKVSLLPERRPLNGVSKSIAKL